jgi:hypothetical protein
MLRVTYAIQTVTPAKTRVAIAKATVAIAMINSGVKVRKSGQNAIGVSLGVCNLGSKKEEQP